MKKLKVKVEILLQYACDTKSWLGLFTNPLVSSVLKNSTLRTDIYGVQRAILEYNVFAFKLKINKYAYELKNSGYFIVLFLCLVKERYFFETLLQTRYLAVL